ncbi:hypothetical protein UFOVP1124_2 [uncultured Caudovirales phage]|uniref:Uncharacterized protein n=1 Tax=uncultured Caudovirales phage TaxID=2100421 RepID=A0A6J5QTZ1_9CAUD|nr:hypothetical protein UFOVP1124_2 [uncultured Caudovirales phage]
MNPFLGRPVGNGVAASFATSTSRNADAAPNICRGNCFRFTSVRTPDGDIPSRRAASATVSQNPFGAGSIFFMPPVIPRDHARGKLDRRDPSRVGFLDRPTNVQRRGLRFSWGD